MNCPDCLKPSTLVITRKHSTRLYVRRLRVCSNCLSQVRTKEIITNYTSPLSSTLIIQTQEFEAREKKETK